VGADSGPAARSMIAGNIQDVESEPESIVV
jgi:hypothetical protein